MHASFGLCDLEYSCATWWNTCFTMVVILFSSSYFDANQNKLDEFEWGLDYKKKCNQVIEPNNLFSTRQAVYI